MRFDLGTVLSVTTGINLAPNGFGDVCVLLDFMTGDSLTDMGRVMTQPACRAALLRQFPALEHAEPPANIANAWRAWLAEQTARLGDSFDVQPIVARVTP